MRPVCYTKNQRQLLRGEEIVFLREADTAQLCNTKWQLSNILIQIAVYGLLFFFIFKVEFTLNLYVWYISMHVYGHLCECPQRLWKDARILGCVSCLMWCSEANSSSLPTQQALLLLSHFSSSLFFDVYLILHLQAQTCISEMQL